MEYLKIGNEVIEYELHKSSRAKKVSISIKNQKVKVTVPMELPLEYAINFVENNKEWLAEHYHKQLSYSENSLPKRYINGEKLLYRGRNYPLLIEEKLASNYYALFIGSRIIVYVPPGLSPERQSAFGKKLIEKWYRIQAEKLLPQQVDYYSKLLGIPYGKLKIKDQKTRWGSCSTKRNINLNWRIIMAPNQVAAYVIIHELTHLNFMNHSKEFWKSVEQYLPDYKKWKKWLTENGKELIL